MFLDFKGEAVIIEIEYSGRIPLNPYETENYEIPDGATDLDDVNVDALWLFMIKKQMDRVFFRGRGKWRILSMMQYRREQGMEKRIWAMSICPKLSRGLNHHLEEGKGDHPGCVLQKGREAALMLGPCETFKFECLNCFDRPDQNTPHRSSPLCVLVVFAFPFARSASWSRLIHAISVVSVNSDLDSTGVEKYGAVSNLSTFTMNVTKSLYIANMLSWRHSGFHVYIGDRIFSHDKAGLGTMPGWGHIQGS